MSEDEPKFPNPEGSQEQLPGFPEVPEKEPPSRPKPLSSKPIRVRYQDSTDASVSASREGRDTTDYEPTPEEQEHSKQVAAFVARAYAESGGLEDYLAAHPELTDEARRLRLIE